MLGKKPGPGYCVQIVWSRNHEPNTSNPVCSFNIGTLSKQLMHLNHIIFSCCHHVQQWIQEYSHLPSEEETLDNCATSCRRRKKRPPFSQFHMDSWMSGRERERENPCTWHHHFTFALGVGTQLAASSRIDNLSLPGSSSVDWPQLSLLGQDSKGDIFVKMAIKIVGSRVKNITMWIRIS